ncbi:MAG: transcriptional repressor LexA [Candidatus Gastranaerophilaceae bacterium]
MLTQKQKEFFEKLKKQYGKDVLPSLETIAHQFGFKHKNSVWQYFNKFKEENLICEENNRYKINKNLFGAIQMMSSVRAGFATAGEDYVEKRVSLDDEFNIDNPSTFLFKVRGDSMVDLGIFEGDTVVVNKCSYANSGDIVLAYIDGGYTLKTLRKKGSDVWLEPANPEYPILRPKETLEIFGTVKGIVRKI